MIEALDAAGMALAIFGVFSFLLWLGASMETRTPWVARLAFVGMLLSVLLGATGAGFGIYAASVRRTQPECEWSEWPCATGGAR